MPYSPSFILIWHTHTDATVYIISTYPAITFHSTPWPILTESVLDELTSLCTALASAVYTLCHLPIKPMIIHILISISHSAAPNIV
ncbi:CLN_G0047760.mRNA.1.CDS.1 [Saccharomyces cerevisiae]|nr:CLN_G0047760.mRNA.1.CDS.1 [Saccharomyces cerevisiae]CAI6546483.1 CMF_HP1_G0022880.mRNA.1.CDS.1 [Saccharomyces cerevisiae]CAI7334450.1 CMF_collapsed_G0024290.mRNA.1.CDS.1 [Saccharomyces cerevisiae]CAI7452046.1 CLN_G0047760.mRNA.1.CDS.1 [Saccharomyces cerevisiae]